jgi:uncharacterized protein YciI
MKPARPEILTHGPTKEEEQLIQEHYDYLCNLADKGVVLLAGRTLNRDLTSFGIVIFLAPSRDEARKIAEADPAVKAGVFQAELYPYSIALVGAIDDVRSG